MSFKQPANCPVCKNNLIITKMTCERCGTELSGKFPQCKYCALDDRLGLFLETFLRCEGNIKAIEKELGISYPTVKNLTEELLNALGITANASEKNASQDVGELLASVERGEISAAEAAAQIRQQKPRK